MVHKECVANTHKAHASAMPWNICKLEQQVELEIDPRESKPNPGQCKRELAECEFLFESLSHEILAQFDTLGNRTQQADRSMSKV